MTITNARALAAGLGIKNGPLHDKLEAMFNEDGSRKMTAIYAVDIIEGMVQSDVELATQAWQYLVDTGMAWKLQGSIGRQADRLINAGFINAPKG